MKNLLIVIATLLILTAAFFAFQKEAPVQPEVPEPETKAPVSQTIQGVVSDINLDQMALDGPALLVVIDDKGVGHTITIPSMGIRLCPAWNRIASPFVMAAGDRVSLQGYVNDSGEITPCESSDHFLLVTGQHTDTDLGYQFTYPKGPEGYVLIKAEAPGNAGFLSGITLMNRTEYETLQESTEAREPPPAIHLRIYRNSQMQSAAVWALRNPRETNYELAMAEPAEAVVGGANAVHFIADGLWPLETYVVANGGHIYVLMAEIPGDNDTLKNDFSALLESFEFIPTPEQIKGTQ